MGAWATCCPYLGTSHKHQLRAASNSFRQQQRNSRCAPPGAASHVVQVVGVANDAQLGVYAGRQNPKLLNGVVWSEAALLLLIVGNHRSQGKDVPLSRAPAA